MPIVLQPVDQVAHNQLAQRLACWAQTTDGLTDMALIYQSCCVSPTGQTIGRWVVPEDLCTVYGPFNFTANEGDVIPCPPTGSAEYVNYYIYDDDVHDIDPNTCIEVTLAAPTGLASPTQGPDTVDLTWNAVVGADTYVVRWSIAGAGEWTESAPTASTSFEIGGLTDETSYDFQVQALAVGAVDSPWSATFTQATTSLGTLVAPTGVAAPSSAGTSIDVTWNEVENATSYTVEWSPTGAGTWTPATSTDMTYTITGLTLGTSYDIRVKATAPGWTDSPYSATIVASTEEQLATVTGLASPSQTGTTVVLTWDDLAEATTYVVRHSPAGAGTWTELAPVGTDGTTVTGLTAGTDYDFQVKAQAEDFVDSEWTASLTQSTAAALGTPVVTSPAQTDTSVSLSWAAIPNATSYTVQSAPTAGGQWEALVPDPVGTTATVTGLTAGTSYKFRVIAHAAGWTDSAWSAELTQATDAPLLAPANLAAGTSTTTTVPLSWDAAVNADTYTVAWSPAGAGTWTEIPMIAGTSTTVTGLTVGTLYDFRIKSVATGFADSGWSATITDSTAIAAPTGLAAGTVTSTSVALTWNAVTNADSYRIRWSPAGAGTWTQRPTTTNLTDTVTGLTASTSYDFQVKAISNTLTDSAWSATLTQATTA